MGEQEMTMTAAVLVAMLPLMVMLVMIVVVIMMLSIVLDVLFFAAGLLQAGRITVTWECFRSGGLDPDICPPGRQ